MMCRVAGSILLTAAILGAQFPGGPPPPTGRPGALIDITGYWVSIIDEDWRWRMVTPPKGDYASVPLNAEGRRVAGMWDPTRDQADGNSCKAYGAAGLMRLPTRLHITWTDEKTLQVETDAGEQKRLFHFDDSKWNGGEPQWQGIPSHPGRSSHKAEDSRHRSEVPNREKAER